MVFYTREVVNLLCRFVKLKRCKIFRVLFSTCVCMNICTYYQNNVQIKYNRRGKTTFFWPNIRLRKIHIDSTRSTLYLAFMENKIIAILSDG